MSPAILGILYLANPEILKILILTIAAKEAYFYIFSIETLSMSHAILGILYLANPEILKILILTIAAKEAYFYIFSLEA